MNNGDEIIIINSLDQDLTIRDENQILDRVTALLMQSIEEKNINKALNICKQLYGIAKLSGLALAKTLYLIKANWEKFEVNDNFDDVITAVTGLHKHTVQTYTAVWDVYENGKIPQKFEEDIMGKNIKLIVPIALTLNQGYDIDETDWEELATANDFSTINAKLREIKGKEPRSHALVLLMDRDGGIKAIKNNEQKYIGWLNTSDENEIVQQAIERLIKGGGILLQ